MLRAKGFMVAIITTNTIRVLYIRRRRHGLLERNYEDLPAFDRRELDALRSRGELPAPETLPLPDNQFPLVRRGLNRLNALVTDVFGSARATATASVSGSGSGSATAAQHANDTNKSH